MDLEVIERMIKGYAIPLNIVRLLPCFELSFGRREGAGKMWEKQFLLNIGAFGGLTAFSAKKKLSKVLVKLLVILPVKWEIFETFFASLFSLRASSVPLLAHLNVNKTLVIVLVF